MSGNVIYQPEVRKLIAQGRQGPPGPAGTGVGIKQGGFYNQNPVNGTIPLIPYTIYDFDITDLLGLKTASGTITVTIQINGIDVGGLANISVTNTPQNVSATDNFSIVEGDRLTIVLSDNSSATELEFTLKGTTI